MNRVLLCLALLVLVAVPAVAQGKAYFPSNAPSGGNTNTFPFGNSFGDNWRYHGWLDATLLPAAKIKITDVAVAPQASGTFTASQCQFRLAHIPGALSSIFGQNLGPCPINLYDGPISFPATVGQWNDIGMQTSFGYDGDMVPQPNMVLEIRYRGRTAGFRSMSDGVASMPRVWANNITTPVTPDPYSVISGRLSTSGGIRICLTYSRTCICDAPLKGQLGMSIPIALLNMPVGDFYQIAASLGQTPLNLGTCTINLTPDSVFLYSIAIGAPIFNYYAGTIPASGQTGGKFVAPKLPALIGICVYHAAIAYGPKGVTCCTNTEGTILTP
jgi:hypothetical protein